MIDLSGKIALVTGASRGIGEGCALSLAHCGADVVINYRTHPEEAQAVADEIIALGRRAIILQADISGREQVDAMLAKTLDEFGRLDIVVANAAYGFRSPAIKIPVEEVKKVWDVNLWGTFHTLQATIAHMVERGGGGKAVVISSVQAFIPFNNNVPYTTSKAGINHMAMTFAEEMAHHRINVNVVEPGWIDTPGERKDFTQEQITGGGRQLPWGRIGTIKDIGDTVAFLASDWADYITGAVLRVDGGFWLPQRNVSIEQPETLVN